MQKMNELKQYVRPLYKHNADRICSEIISYAKDFPHNENPYPNLLWYKFLNLYAVYPDAIENGNAVPLARLIPRLAHVKRLGCNALHILPFLASPLIDAGFDVSDYFRVRDDLGTMEDLKNVAHEAQRLGIRLIMDLVSNHVSDQHEWFQKAEAGTKNIEGISLYRRKGLALSENFIKTVRCGLATSSMVKSEM